MNRTAEIAVTMDGRTPLVDATINGRPAHLVFDTGADTTILMTGAATKFDLTPTPNPPHVQMTSQGKAIDLTFLRVRHFTFGAAAFDDIDFPATNAGMDVDGFLGQNHIGDQDVEIDLGHGVVRWFAPQGCSNAELAYWAGEAPVSTVDIEVASPRIFGIVEANGVFIRAMFDTGSPGSAFESRAAGRAGVFPDSPGVTATAPALGLNPKFTPRTWSGTFGYFKIGRETIANAQLKFIEKQNASADMLIGADFFLTHRVYISKSRRELLFTYNGGDVFGSKSVAVAADR
jgi:predicted aspartyl protease